MRCDGRRASGRPRRRTSGCDSRRSWTRAPRYGSSWQRSSKSASSRSSRYALCKRSCEQQEECPTTAALRSRQRGATRDPCPACTRRRVCHLAMRACTGRSCERLLAGGGVIAKLHTRTDTASLAPASRFLSMPCNNRIRTPTVVLASLASLPAQLLRRFIKQASLASPSARKKLDLRLHDAMPDGATRCRRCCLSPEEALKRALRWHWRFQVPQNLDRRAAAAPSPPSSLAAVQHGWQDMPTSSSPPTACVSSSEPSKAGGVK